MLHLQSFHNRTLYKTGKQTSESDEISQIEVGNFPITIAINERINTVYVANYYSATVSVIDGDTTQKIKDIKVGNEPIDIAIDTINRVFVANRENSSISIIDGETNEKLHEDIPVGACILDIAVNQKSQRLLVSTCGDQLLSMYPPMNADDSPSIEWSPTGEFSNSIGINERTFTVYVANTNSDNVSVIDERTTQKIKDIHVDSPLSIEVNERTNTTYVAPSTFGEGGNLSVINETTYTKIKDIPVEGGLIVTVPVDFLGINHNTNTVYVTNRFSDNVTVIDGDTNEKIKDITVGKGPIALGINENTNTVYVTNSDSDSISVIDSIYNKLVIGTMFQVNPFNSGYIICDKSSSPSPISQYFYISPNTQCVAKPYQGFEFLSWEETLKNNSTQIITVSRPASTWESIKDFFNLKSEEPEAKLNIAKFGTFTANFKELPPPLPPEYWATLFGVVVTAFISSWLTPTIIGWRKAKGHQDKLNNYQKELIDMYKDNKLDKSDISNLNKLRENVMYGYTRGDITKDQYDVLLNNISTKYNEIFKNEMNILKYAKNINEKIKPLEELKSDLNDAYLKKKIDKGHYDLLKEMISEFEKNNNNNDENSK